MLRIAFHTSSMSGNCKFTVIRDVLTHIKSYMKSKVLLAVATMLGMVMSVCAYDYQVAGNPIGDSKLLTLGGFSFAKPFSIDLAPTNAPDEEASYLIRCQIIYVDRTMQRPETDVERAQVRRTGGRLNDWLKEFVVAQYVGAEYGTLLAAYFDHQIEENLNALFPEYVAEKIASMAPDERLDIAAVTVDIEAEGEFRAALVELLNQQVAAQQN